MPQDLKGHRRGLGANLLPRGRREESGIPVGAGRVGGAYKDLHASPPPLPLGIPAESKASAPGIEWPEEVPTTTPKKPERPQLKCGEASQGNGCPNSRVSLSCKGNSLAWAQRPSLRIHPSMHLCVPAGFYPIPIQLLETGRN